MTAKVLSRRFDSTSQQSPVLLILARRYTRLPDFEDCKTAIISTTNNWSKNGIGFSEPFQTRQEELISTFRKAWENCKNTRTSIRTTESIRNFTNKRRRLILTFWDFMSQIKTDHSGNKSINYLGITREQQYAFRFYTDGLDYHANIRLVRPNTDKPLFETIIFRPTERIKGSEGRLQGRILIGYDRIHNDPHLDVSDSTAVASTYKHSHGLSLLDVWNTPEELNETFSGLLRNLV